MAERIRELCRIKGTNIKCLERALGFGNGTISRWDVSSPSVDKVAKVAAYFGVTCDYIING